MAVLVRKWQIVLFGAVTGAAMFGAGLVAGLSVGESFISFVIVLGYAVVVAALQSRSETASALAGRPVDERWQLIHERSLVFTAEVGVVISLAGFLVAELLHRDAGDFALVAAAMGLSYIVGIVINRWRM